MITFNRFANHLLRYAGALSMACWFHAASADDSGSPWAQDYFPNTELITQDGKTVHFYDDLIKDKVVAINFIFTSCTDSCPLETARLRRVQQLLGDRVGKDVFFYSISIDPQTDTPEVLKHYSEKFHVAPGWLFLTGNKDEIDALREKLGLFLKGVDDQGNKDHNLSLIVGNQQTGRWMKTSPFENPYILAYQLGNTLHNWKHSTKTTDYADAPQVRPPSTGEEIFRTRCAACHTLGGADSVAAGLREIGPDLIGVTRKRDPQWLQRWLREPDKMLAESDPIATELYQQYNQVAMPNLRLGDEAIAALLGYLEDETQRVQPLRTKEAEISTMEHDPAHHHHATN